MNRIRLAQIMSIVLAALASGTIAAAQPSDSKASDDAITVIDEGGKVHRVTAAELTRMANRKTMETESDGNKQVFEGVLLVDFLRSLGVGFGDELKGPRASTVVLIEALDRYRVVFSLLEIDPATAAEGVLLADRQDGKPLGEKEGPFRLVVPNDKRHVRWIRMVRWMRIVNLKDAPLASGSPQE
jgi:hypothetical protein